MSDSSDSRHRAVHFVGTVPASDARAAYETFAAGVGDHLPVWIPDGETGDRQDWIKRIIDGLRNHPDLRLVRDGDWSDYESTPSFDVKPGHKLTNIELDYTSYFKESWPAFLDFRRADGSDHIFQVGIPSQLDLALVAFGFKATKGLRNLAPFRDATVREITKIQAIGGDDVVFQIEIPIPVILLSKVPAAAQPTVAKRLASEIIKVVRRSPGGTRFGIHLCYGDMNNESMADPSDSSALVRLANAIFAAWPKGQRLDFVHAPFARGSIAPTLDPVFYEPLARLRIPGGVRFAGGFVHEDLTVDQLRFIRDRIEGLIGATIDVGSACGLGRRDPERALKNIELSRAVAE